ncbi:MAG: pseudouridylate synthase [Bacteroidaceae bacterium]|jgi:predicted hotdog family 3-hydroxylacyl-ACP dehydratase|nr:pseudouridylate synthase [Bacteroidaceae bacterium]
MHGELINPTDEFVQSIDIHILLPQQEPFVLIDKMIHFSTDKVLTQFCIREDCIFVSQGTLSANGLLENIAQTCAARIGFISRYIFNNDIKPGVIGAIRNAEIISLPKVGDTITTEVVIREEAFGMSLAEAAVTLGEKTLATTEIKIAI